MLKGQDGPRRSRFPRGRAGQLFGFVREVLPDHWLLLTHMATISQCSGSTLIFRCHLDKSACCMRLSRFGGHPAAIGSVINQGPDFYLHQYTTAPVDPSFATSHKSGKSGNKYRSGSLDDLVIPGSERCCMEHCQYLRATQQAWAIYLAQNDSVSPEDGRRCSLERFVRERWKAGETGLDELTCSGLSFLTRLCQTNSW